MSAFAAFAPTNSSADTDWFWSSPLLTSLFRWCYFGATPDPANDRMPDLALDFDGEPDVAAVLCYAMLCIPVFSFIIGLAYGVAMYGFRTITPLYDAIRGLFPLPPPPPSPDDELIFVGPRGWPPN